MNAAKKSAPYIILIALIGAGAAAQGLFKASSSSLPVTDTPPQIQNLNSETPAEVSSNPGQCAYVWAYHDLPDVTEKLQKAIQEIKSDATAHAQAYGEDCVYNDGTSTFGAMETDFYFTFQADLSNEDDLGNLIIQSMKVIKLYPPGTVPGPQLGRVNFTFEQGEQELNLIADIRKYNDLPPDASGHDVYQAFKNP